MTFRKAELEDCALLALWNQQLIRDEGSRNTMTLADLEARMHRWLSDEYRGIIFEESGSFAGYALYWVDVSEVFLRQYFIAPERRRQGLGLHGLRILRQQVWPHDRRLTVDVLTSNTAALAFWRAAGYTDYALTLEILPGAAGAPD